jgi:hypothetical protein
MCDAPARAEDPDHGAREPGRAGLCRRADQQEKAAVLSASIFWDPDTVLFLYEEPKSDLLGCAEFDVFICRLKNKNF